MQNNKQIIQKERQLDSNSLLLYKSLTFCSEVLFLCMLLTVSQTSSSLMSLEQRWQRISEEWAKIYGMQNKVAVLKWSGHFGAKCC